MADHTVFGTGVPPWTPTVHTDGTPSIQLGNYFYTHGSSVDGWRCRGGRVYFPDDATTNSQTVAISVYLTDSVTAVNLSNPPIASGTTTIGSSGGWAEVTWAPFTVQPAATQFVFIAYEVLSVLGAYVAVPSLTVGSGSIAANDGSDLALLEEVRDSISRGYSRLGSDATVQQTQWYGTDIILDEGQDTPLPIAAYGFNETSGTTAHDDTDNERHLEVLSSANFNTGRNANGLHQGGDGGDYRIENTIDWLETDHRTVMFWGRRGAEGVGTWSHTIYQMEGESQQTVFGVMLNNNDDEAQFRMRGVSGTNYDITTSEVSLGTWAHYAVTYDRENLRAYVDGVMVGEVAVTEAIHPSDGKLYFFGLDYQQQVVDDLRFFDGALVQGDITYYMNTSIAPRDYEAPTLPANVSGSAVYQEVTLDWDDSTDNVEVQNYAVYRSSESGFTPNPSNQVGGPSISTYTETAPVGTWYYRVSARDEEGNESEASPEYEMVVTEAPVPGEARFPSDLGWSIGTETLENAANGMTFGMIAAVSAATAILGGRFYSPVAKSNVQVYLVEGETPVAYKTGLSLSIGWNSLMFDEQYIAQPGNDYKIAVFIPGPTVTYTTLPNAWDGSMQTVGTMYSTLAQNCMYAYGNADPTTASSSWYGIDFVANSAISDTFDATFGATIEEENAKDGALGPEWMINGAGATDNLGFARQFSVSPGETVDFSCHGAGERIDVYRIGYYGGTGWRKVAEVINTPTTQPDPDIIPDSNGGVTCSNWSTTASWSIPEEALSGLFVGVYRTAAEDNASYIPFVVHDHTRVADITYKTSDTTWALAYNYYGTPNSPLTGKSLHGSGGPLGDISTRTHAVTYHRPIVTREGVPQTYWLACEAPLIRYLERNGYDVKYVASRDLDLDASCLDNGSVFISSGHDEYWSDGMRGAVETYRDAGGHALFMSGSEVFWRTRFDAGRDTMWCYKDTMDGPGAHVGGQALDPVGWTGTWKDTRFQARKPEHRITGTDLRMNGVNDYAATLEQSAEYASHTVWRNSDLQSGDVTFQGVIGFEADRILPTQPSESVEILAAHTLSINGSYADDNGQDYAGNGDLTWGIVSQRYSSGAVVVGFGTCQWSWSLDIVHDRGGNYVQPAAQQFMVNLLGDLGAQPGTLMAGLTATGAQSLDNYGLVPSLDSHYSVFGREAPAFVPNLMTDGTPSITLGNGFYVTVAGYSCAGGRVYVPYGSLAGETIEIMAYVTDVDTPVDLSQPPLRSEEVTVSDEGGWQEVTWEPFIMEAPVEDVSEQFVYIVYQVTSQPASYLFVDGTTYGSDATESVDLGASLALLEATHSTMDFYRGQFRQGSGNTTDAVAWYGIDILAQSTTSTNTGKVKVWTGSQWDAHSLKVYDGSQWVVRATKGHNGSGFIEGNEA